MGYKLGYIRDPKKIYPTLYPMPLTNLQIKQAQPKEKPYKLYDGQGLYLMPNDSKYFCIKYQGKRQTLALWGYPKVSLKETKHRCDEARRLRQQSIDPAIYCKTRKINGDAGLIHLKPWRFSGFLSSAEP